MACGEYLPSSEVLTRDSCGFVPRRSACAKASRIVNRPCVRQTGNAVYSLDAKSLHKDSAHFAFRLLLEQPSLPASRAVSKVPRQASKVDFSHVNGLHM